MRCYNLYIHGTKIQIWANEEFRVLKIILTFLN